MINQPLKNSISFFKTSRLSYTLGFGLSLLLTSGAFYLYSLNDLQTPSKIGAILLLGLIQLCVQLFFFLHLFEEKKPRWNLLSFLFMVLVVVIIGFGSLWIMNNLNQRTMMSEEEMHHYMLEQEGIKKNAHH